jgi:hypothetical protein
MVPAASIDRLGRDPEHIAGFNERMNVPLGSTVAAAQGAIIAPPVRLKRTMCALYLTNLAGKTHRAHEGRLRAGKSAGRRYFAYCKPPGIDG